VVSWGLLGRGKPYVEKAVKLTDRLSDKHKLNIELGRFDEAIAEYERILKLNPNYPLVHYHLAQPMKEKANAIKHALNMIASGRHEKRGRGHSGSSRCQESSTR
jgi:tetratricopeptide (TPR) repeat protein